MTDATWFVYMLECRSKRIYTGVTPRLDQRILAHQKGQGALFTKLDSPQGLIAAKPFPSQREARQVELQVKRLPAAYKRTLARLWSEQHPIDEIAQQLFPPQ
ncbi:GIY-YIG nuclease family protein [Pseudomonas aeruginosa]|uniref:GIY-YIG nuclease family protein n=2 Tax=Pseudomonas aeruginosa TaxID=287 RepID=A0A367MHV0_PSEAI|nr:MULTISPECIES: GIY-YIG nuclease family protein [Pseudomonadaceae]MDH2244376.1 GIY-YIG nuclease family protein [Pseudomonas sp. GD03909]HDS0931059.1 GIY-YIG nuclease family protein [Pseudomonas putida]EIU3469028.1 GIY-YIG nuclease family protein [Pseudomonas aeruginosa]EKO9560224.1 GIY-YIG nuclease family protein [Pseudomonas aeruginosa]EKP5712684.1 GIY-YIG nuclease family protein [Pseudomonas aeruginosa]